MTIKLFNKCYINQRTLDLELINGKLNEITFNNKMIYVGSTC